MRKVDIKIKLALGLIFLATLTANSQQVSLSEIEEMAIKNNRTLRASALEIDRNQAAVGTYREISRTIVEVQFGNTQTPFVNDYTATVLQNFESPGYYKTRKKLLESYVQQANVTLDLRQLEIRQRVRQSYVELIHEKLLLDFLKNQDSIYQKAARKAEIRYRTGETSILEKIHFETQLNALKNRINVTQIELRIPYLKLKNLAVLSDSISFSENEFYGRNIIFNGNNLPWLRSIDAEKANLQEEILVEKSRLKPGFIGGITNQSMNGSLRQFVITAGLNIPISKRAVQSKIESLSIEKQVLDARLEALEYQLLTEFQTLQTQRNSLLSTLDYLEKMALPNAELMVATALKQYNGGEINYLEFQQIYTPAIAVRETFLQRQFELKLNETELRYITGQ